MSQISLFDASVYTLRAYDQLVLAYAANELEQLRSLKQQTIRTWLAIQELGTAASDLPPSLPLFDAITSDHEE